MHSVDYYISKWDRFEVLTRLVASIQKLLNLNHDPRPAEDAPHDPSGHGGLISHSTPILNEDGDPIWKVLVFDSMGRDVISSVLRVNDLRAWGITIHLYSPWPVLSPSDFGTSMVTDNALSLLETSLRKDILFPMFLLFIWWSPPPLISKQSRTISPMASTPQPTSISYPPFPDRFSRTLRLK